MFFFGLAAHNIIQNSKLVVSGALPGLRCSWHALHISANPTFVGVWAGLDFPLFRLNK